ncbi:MAG: hypothetical protein ACI4RA_04005, partial [Kiritimatiellia bacterium]
MGGAFGVPVAEEVEGRWQLTVPEGETYTMTAEDVAQIGDRPFQKAGGGTLIAGDEMGVHTGDVHVVDGLYRNATRLGFGSETAPKGMVYVDGGTILNAQASGSESRNPAIPHNLVLKGEGYRGFGAISNVVQSLNICSAARLAGDTKVTGTATFNFRYDSFDFGGYTLTTEFSRDTVGLMFVAAAIKNPGSIVVKRGLCGFESEADSGGTAAQTMTFAEGTRLKLSVLLSSQGRTLHFADKTTCEVFNWDGLTVNPATGKHGTKNTGFLTGPVILEGTLSSVASTKDAGVTFTGPISGPGGFAFLDGLWLRLGSDANTFAGGVEVAGVLGSGALDMKGGLALTATHAVPVAGGVPLKMKNATLGLYATKEHELPALQFDGTVAVTGDVARTACRAASLVKTGDGPLTVFGPLTVAGDTDIRGGTLRFATRVPDYLPGLYWAHNDSTGGNSDAAYTPEQIQARNDYQGIEATGLAYAYRNWINTVATTNWNQGKIDRVDWHNNHFYAGYMKIPGEPGTDVSCRFISCIARHSRLDIDGVTVLRVDDGKVTVPSDFVDPDPDGNLGWTRHAWSGPVVLKAGWHRVYCYMGNHYLTGGPVSCGNPVYGLWPANFGYGVNYAASESDSFDVKTNVVNYAKLLDPGDGSFMRTSTNEAYRATLDAAQYRPAFGGAVAFASGTALDMGDTAPYVPVVMPSLTGVPTLRNGRVEVGSPVWRLRAADVTGGVPLTIEGTAGIAFPEGEVTVELSAEELAALESEGRNAPFAIMRAEAGAALPGNAFVASDAVKAARWRVVREGATISLVRASGMA